MMIVASSLVNGDAGNLLGDGRHVLGHGGDLLGDGGDPRSIAVF